MPQYSATSWKILIIIMWTVCHGISMVLSQICPQPLAVLKINRNNINNINERIILKFILHKDDLIHHAKDLDCWRALVNWVLYILLPQNLEISWLDKKIHLSFPRQTLLHGMDDFVHCHVVFLEQINVYCVLQCIQKHSSGRLVVFLLCTYIQHMYNSTCCVTSICLQWQAIIHTYGLTVLHTIHITSHL